MVDVLNSNQSPDTLEFHTYGEFYVPGTGWFPLSPSRTESSAFPILAKFDFITIQLAGNGQEQTPTKFIPCAP